MIYAILIMVVAGLVLGLILGIASDKLVVKEDPLIAKITELLPGFNCGGCGFAGCSGFANALVNGDADKISRCRPSKPDARQVIKDTFDETPDKNGNIVKVEIE